MLPTGKILSGYLAIGLLFLYSCRGETKSNSKKIETSANTTVSAEKADTLVYWIPGVLPDLYGAKAEKWASEKYGFIINHPGCETNDSIVTATQNNNKKLFIWLNSQYQIPDEQSLQRKMMQYTHALKEIHSILDDYLKEAKIGSRKHHYADLLFNFTDSTQKEFMVQAYDIDGSTGKRTGNAVVFRVNTASKNYLANPDE